MDRELKRKAIIEFGAVFIIVLIVFLLSVVKTNAYNQTKHQVTLSGNVIKISLSQNKAGDQ